MRIVKNIYKDTYLFLKRNLENYYFNMKFVYDIINVFKYIYL